MNLNESQSIKPVYEYRYIRDGIILPGYGVTVILAGEYSEPHGKDHLCHVKFDLVILALTNPQFPAFSSRY